MTYVTHDFYLNQLLKLLPTGKAWNITDDSDFYKLLRAISKSLADVHNQTSNLLKEVDPLQTMQMLPEFENLLNLPESCKVHDNQEQYQTLQQRRINLNNKLLRQNSNTRQYLISYAKILGYEVEVEELFESRFDEDFSDFTNDQEVNTINIIVNNVEKASSCFDDFFGQDFGLVEQDNHVECMLDRIIPAHLKVIYTYK